MEITIDLHDSRVERPDEVCIEFQRKGGKHL